MNKRTKQNDEDDELLHLTKLLTTIHKEYFDAPDSSIIDILNKKKNIFQGLKFYTTNTKLKNKIEDYGGYMVRDMEDANYILSDTDEYKDEYKDKNLVVLNEIFIYESVYRLKKGNIEDYLIYDFSEDDQLIDEIFGDEL
ncbi:hypothetical protein P3W45_001074 [Vairimorpha bombi]